MYLVRILGNENTELLPELVFRLSLLGNKLVLREIVKRGWANINHINNQLLNERE